MSLLSRPNLPYHSDLSCLPDLPDLPDLPCLPCLPCLPDIIIPIANPDKTWHEEWTSERGKLNFPHPFRAVLLGPPNTGKTTTCKNILLRQEPPFERVVVVHCDPDFTHEYDDIGAEMIADIPAPEEWPGDMKTLVILDDLEFKGLNKLQTRNLDRLYGFVSTHKNISCCLCAQDPFNVPPAVRRCANLWVLWKSVDMDAMATCARRTGMRSDAFRQIFNDLITGEKDSFWIDLTDKTPMKFRKNGFQEIAEISG